MLKKISLLFLFITFFTINAHAMILLAPSISYLEQSQTQNNIEVDAKLTVIDLRLGWVTDFGLYLGGLYSIQDQDILSDSSDSYFGPSVGFYRNGFFGALTYYIYGERDITSGAGKWSDVQGFQLDLAYGLLVSEGVRIGPQLTYQSIEFSELQVSGIPQSDELQFTALTPAFSVIVEFP
jgi:hypothetical protein